MTMVRHMSGCFGKMPRRVTVAQLEHRHPPALRGGDAPFQLSRSEGRLLRCESCVLQFFELRQQLVSSVELTSFKLRHL